MDPQIITLILYTDDIITFQEQRKSMESKDSTNSLSLTRKDWMNMLVTHVRSIDYLS